MSNRDVNVILFQSGCKLVEFQLPKIINVLYLKYIKIIFFFFQRSECEVKSRIYSCTPLRYRTKLSISLLIFKVPGRCSYLLD